MTKKEILHCQWNDINLHVGQKVCYQPKHLNEDHWENGIIKEIPPDNTEAVLVVFNCGGDWGNYKNYTGALTNITDLHNEWKLIMTKSDTIVKHEIELEFDTNPGMYMHTVLGTMTYDDNEGKKQKLDVSYVGDKFIVAATIDGEFRRVMVNCGNAINKAAAILIEEDDNG